MSRCSICDYSQSADSLYFDSLAVSRSVSNNRVVYSPDLKKDVCISCLEDHLSLQNYWASIEDFENVPETETEAAAEFTATLVEAG